MDFNSRLVFGISGIAKLGSKGGYYLLETARDLGISHFDVAPLYGYGIAENYLGDFVKYKRHSIHITTKAGIGYSIFTPYLYKLHLYLMNFNRINSKSLPKNFVSNTSKLWRTNFDANYIESSVNSSLKRLKTDYIDCLLLHEAQLLHFSNDDLIKVLHKLKSDGKVLKFGIGGQCSNVIDAMELDDIYEVLQINAGYNFANIASIKSIYPSIELNIFSVYNDNSLLKDETIMETNNLHLNACTNRMALLLFNAIMLGATRVLFSTNKIDNLILNVGDLRKISQEFVK